MKINLSDLGVERMAQISHDAHAARPWSELDEYKKEALRQNARESVRHLEQAWNGEGSDEAELPTPVRLYPQTAREALLEIRRIAETGPESIETTMIDGIALEGLARTEPINFELTDYLADHLAKAHGVLNEVRQHLYGKLPDGDNAIEQKVLEAMSLPPDLETIVERHKR